MIRGLQPGCKELSPKYSAFVDGAAGPLLTELIEHHLLTCDVCVAEVRSLVEVREQLGASAGSDESAGAELQSRLLSIAGQDAGSPLALRAGPGALPTRVQARRRILAASVLITVAAVVAWGAIGLSAAPPLLSRADLDDEARMLFASALAASVVGSPAVAAVLTRPESFGPPTAGTPRSPRLDESAPAADPAEVLTRAALATDPVHGSTRVSFWSGSGYRTAEATMSLDSTEAVVAVHDSRGVPLTTRRLTTAPTPSLPDWWAGDYALRGWRAAGVVAGRTAAVVEASLPTRLIARWWVDEDTGHLLWEERYGASGEVVSSAGFTSFHEGAGELVPDDKLVRPLAGVDTSACSAGWSCPTEVLGLPVISRQQDRHASPTTMQSVYSDHVTTVVVVQRRGVLAPASGTTLLRSAGVEENEPEGGPPAGVTWQSGGFVFTVLSTDSMAATKAAAHSLPHEPARSADLGDRILSGWARLWEEL